MLAVTAGDGACRENSTQPTARVSQVVCGAPDTGARVHHLHVPGFGSRHLSDSGPDSQVAHTSAKGLPEGENPTNGQASLGGI
jgi:hypothetical protein